MRHTRLTTPPLARWRVTLPDGSHEYIWAFTQEHAARKVNAALGREAGNASIDYRTTRSVRPDTKTDPFAT